MPKKMGMNTKAVDAKARKNDKKVADDAQKQKNAEDEYWKDDDKLTNKKQNRKEDKEAKRVKDLENKKEKEKMLEEELASIKTKKQAPTKVTQFQLTEAKNTKTKNVEEPIPENVNRIDEAEGDARNVEDALKMLSVDDGKPERHAEKRVKAAYKAFEETRLPELKEEHRGLRLTQLKQLLWKEFEKSPLNPKNQNHDSYNTKA